MDKIHSKINNIVVNIFNNMLHIEEETLRRKISENVTINELHVIAAIGINENKTMSEISKRLNVTTSTATTNINNLVKKNLATRYKNENDRRLVYIKLTDEGESLFRYHEQFHIELVETILQNLEDNEQLNLLRSLEKISQFLLKYQQSL